MNALSLGLVQLLMTATFGGVGVPMAIPPTPEDPALAAAAPEDCLFYTSWAGIASPDPKSANQAEQLLAEPEVQNFLEQIGRGMEKAFAEGGSMPDKSSSAVLPIVSMCLNHPGAIFFSKPKLTKQPEGEAAKEEGADSGPKALDSSLMPGYDLSAIDFAFVVSLGDDTEDFKTALDGFLETMDSQPVEAVEIEGNTWWRKPNADPVKDPMWGFQGRYFIMTNEQSRPKVVERMKHAPPKWWTAAGKQLPIERRSTVTYLNLQEVRELIETFDDAEKKNDHGQILDMLGLAGAKALVEVSGLEGEYFTTKTLLTLQGEPRGLLRLVSDKPLKADDLAAIPRDATLALAVRLNLQQALDVVLGAVEKMSPDTRSEIKQLLDEAEDKLGVDIRQKAFGSLGDRWCIYNSPREGGFIATGLTAVVPLRDRAGFSLAWTRLMELARKRLEATAEESPASATTLEQFQFAGQEVYCFNAKICAPAMAITEKEAVFALSPQNVKAYLARGEEHEPIHRMPQVAKLFNGKADPTLVYFSDTPRLFELIYPMITFYAPAITDGFRQAKIDVDLSFIPSAAAFTRHLRPSLLTLRRSKHGLELTTHNVIPMPGPMLILGMMVSGAYGAAQPAPTVTFPVPASPDGSAQPFLQPPEAPQTEEGGEPFKDW